MNHASPKRRTLSDDEVFKRRKQMGNDGLKRRERRADIPEDYGDDFGDDYVDDNKDDGSAGVSNDRSLG